MTDTIGRVLVLLGVILAVVAGSFAVMAQTSQQPAQEFPSSIPQPPVMTNDKLLALVGQEQAQAALLTEYARSLEATVTKLDGEIRQLKAAQEAQKAATSSCTSSTVSTPKKGQ